MNKRLLLLTLLFGFSCIIAQEADEPIEIPDDFNGDVITFDGDDAAQVETVIDTSPPATPTEQQPAVSITMNFPIIGSVKLSPQKDPKTGKEELVGSLDKLEKINDILGPLSIKIHTFGVRLPEAKKPQVIADLEAFSKHAQLVLMQVTQSGKLQTKKEGTKKELILTFVSAKFRIVFDPQDQPTVPLLPGKSVKLSYIDLIIEEGKAIELKANVKWFGQPVKLSVAAHDKTLTSALALKNVTLGQLFPFLSGTPLKDIECTAFSIITNLSKGPTAVESHMTAQVNLTQFTKDLPFSIAASDAEFTIQANSNKEVSINGKLNDLSLFNLLTLKAPTLDISYKPGMTLPNMIITGIGTLDHADLPKLTFDVKGVHDKDTGFTFIGKLTQPESWHSLQLASGDVTINTKSKSAVLQAAVDGFSLPILGSISGAQADIQIDEGKKLSASITGSGKLSIQGLPQPEVTVSGSFKDSALDFTGATKPFEWLGMQIGASHISLDQKANKAHFDAEVTQMTIPFMSDIKATLSADVTSLTSDIAPTVLVHGSAILKVPEFGDFASSITGSYKDGGLEVTARTAQPKPWNNIQLKDLSATVHTKDKTGSLRAALEAFNLPILGTITGELDAKLAQQGQPEVTIKGSGNLKIAGLTNVGFSGSGSYVGKNLIFKGEAHDHDEIEWTQHGISILKIKAAQLELDVNAKKLTISGESSLFDGRIPIVAHLTVTLKGNEPEIEFAGSAKDIKPFKDFVKLQGLEGITLKDITVALDLAKKQTGLQASFTLSGATEILGIPLQASLSAIKDQSGTGFMLEGKVPADKKIPGVDLNFKEAAIIVSTMQNLAQNIQQGLNLKGTVDLSDLLNKLNIKDAAQQAKFKDAFKLNPTLTVFAKLDMDPEKINFGIQLSDGIALNCKSISAGSFCKSLTFGPLDVAITGAPTVALAGKVTLDLATQEEPLIFVGSVDVGVVGVDIDGGMKGPISVSLDKFFNEKAFQEVFKGFSIADLVIGLGIPYTITETFVPNRIALGGTLGLNIGVPNPFPKKVALYAVYDYEKLDLGFYGELDDWTLSEIVKSFFVLPFSKTDISVNVPGVTLNKGLVSFAPKTVNLGTAVATIKSIPMGVAIQGDLTVLGTKAVGAALEVSTNGLIGKAYMPSVSFGPISLKGSDKDPESDKGALIDIELTLDRQIFKISANLSLGELIALDEYISLSKDGAAFNFEGQIYKLYDAHISGSTTSLKDPNFNVAFEFKNQLPQKITSAAVDSITELENEYRSKVEGASSKVNEWLANVAHWQNENVRLSNVFNAAKSAKDAADRALSGAKGKLESFINSIKKKAPSWLGSAIDKIASWLGKAGELSGLRDAVSKAESFFKDRVNDLSRATKALDDAVSNLRNSEANLAQATSSALFTSFKNAGLVYMEGNKYIYKGFGAVSSLFTIEAVKAEGSAENIIDGTLLKNVTIKGRLAGQPVNVVTDLDFKDITAGLNNVKQLVRAKLKSVYNLVS